MFYTRKQMETMIFKAGEKYSGIQWDVSLYF